MYEQGLVYTRRSAQVSLDLGIGVRKIDLPVYNTDHNLFDPKQVIISVGDTTLQYGLTLSTEGLINEYAKPCEGIVNGEKRTLAPLADIEEIKIDSLTL